MSFDRVDLPAIERIYDAAADPSCWAATLEALAAPCHGNSFIVIHDPVMRSGTCSVYANWEPHWVDAYNRHYASRNAWLARVATRPIGKAEPAEFFLGRPDLVRTEWYNDFLRPQKLISGAGVTLFNDRSRFVCAGMFLPDCPEAEHRAHVARLQRLTPHLQRALQVNRQLAAAEFRWQAAEQSFNRLRVGVVLVGPGRRLIFANHEAERILQQQDGLRLDRTGQLVAVRGEEDTRLQRMLHALTSGPSVHETGGVLTVQRHSGRRAYRVLVAALRLPAMLLEAPGTVAALFIVDPVSRRRPSPGMLAQAFDLTPAEARLLDRLLQGHGVTEAALHLGVSPNTAKTQLRGLFDAMDCSRQADVVRLAMSHPVWLTTGPGENDPESARTISSGRGHAERPGRS